MEAFRDKVKKYADMWLDSPAADAYRDVRNQRAYTLSLDNADCRNAKVKGPGAIAVEHIKSWSEKEGEASYPGIPWTIDVVLDIFSILEEISPIGVHEISGQRWFELDIPDIDIPHSWGSRLLSAAAAHVVDFINLGLAQGQRAHLYNQDKNLFDSLSKIATPGLPNNTFPPFPVKKLVLSECLRQMRYSENVATPPPDTFHRVLKEKVDAIHSGGTPCDGSVVSSFEKDSGGISHGRGVGSVDPNHQFTEELRSGLQDIGVDPSEYQGLDFSNPAAFPTVTPDPTRLSPFLVGFIRANQYGRAVLHLEDLSLQQKRLMLIIKDCQERLQWLNGRKAEISRSLEGYRKAKFFVNDMLEKVKSEEYSYGGLMEEMESAYADPEYRMAYSDGQSFQHPDAYRQSQHFPGPPAHPPSTYYNYSSDPVFGVPASVLQSQRYPPPPSVGHP
jgi:hypothetical protein